MTYDKDKYPGLRELNEMTKIPVVAKMLQRAMGVANQGGRKEGQPAQSPFDPPIDPKKG